MALTSLKHAKIILNGNTDTYNLYKQHFLISGLNGLLVRLLQRKLVTASCSSRYSVSPERSRLFQYISYALHSPCCHFRGDDFNADNELEPVEVKFSC